MLNSLRTTVLTISVLSTIICSAFLTACDKSTNSKIDTAQPQQEQSKVASLDYAKIKPSTVNFPELKIENSGHPVTKPDNLDWSKVNPKTQVAKDILSALQNGDDLKLEELTREAGILSLDSSLDMGAHYEPSPEEAAQQDDFYAIFEAQPAIALELAKYGERIKDHEVTYTWYEKAINYGSGAAVAEYEKYGKSSPAAAWPVAVHYEDTNPLKAIEFSSLAAKSDKDNFRQLALKMLNDLVWKNGPFVSAAASKGLIGNASVNQNEGSNISATKCKELGVDFIDPTRRGAFTGSKLKSEVVTYCLSALATSPDNSIFWYNYANAQQAEDKFLEAQIGLARAAQLGHPIAIARYWFNHYASNPDRAIKYLETESKQGNPYGDLFLAQIFDGSSYDKTVDIKKAEQLYLQSYKKGVTVASYKLGDFYSNNKDFSSALNWYQKASTTFPEAYLKLGSMYELGEGVKQDPDQAMRLYEKASSQDAVYAGRFINRVKESKKKLALTGKKDGNYIPKNTIYCDNAEAFTKVDIIERSGNQQYIDLTNYGCSYLPESKGVTITTYTNTLMGEKLAVISTPIGNAYVRKRDVR